MTKHDTISPAEPASEDTLVRVWGLWKSVKAMAAETGHPYGRLYRAKQAGELPPAELDLTILKRARERGVKLGASDLMVFRDRRRASVAENENG